MALADVTASISLAYSSCYMKAGPAQLTEHNQIHTTDTYQVVLAK